MATALLQAALAAREDNPRLGEELDKVHAYTSSSSNSPFITFASSLLDTLPKSLSLGAGPLVCESLRTKREHLLSFLGVLYVGKVMTHPKMAPGVVHTLVSRSAQDCCAWCAIA